MLKRSPKPERQSLGWIDTELVQRLQVKAMEAGRTFLDELEFRLKRDLEREAMGPRRSVRIRRKKYHADRS